MALQDPPKPLKPFTQDVDPNSLVSTHVQKLASDPNNLLNRQAKTRAAQEANRRGLINSGTAVGQGQEAVLNSSLQIARPDAATHGAQSLANQGAENDRIYQQNANDQRNHMVDAENQNTIQRTNITAATELQTNYAAQRDALLNSPEYKYDSTATEAENAGRKKKYDEAVLQAQTGYNESRRLIQNVFDSINYEFNWNLG